ncbi:PLD nuclease N-terminal domain-containing protein [uncultured Robinsoniella sp.]|uniref:PLD nuclease N-terminal domain-containing protein n=1 Tax=uncultured Robinsoniella sp. TaxID=904190 RepID=UPI00374E23C3
MKLSMSLSEFLAMLPNILPLLIPIVLLMLILILTAIISILKKKLPFSEKVIWLVIILFVNTIGPVLYFAVGAKMLDEKIRLRNEEK